MERFIPLQNTFRLGVWLALGTAIISGVSVYLNKFAVTAVPDAVLFTTLKNTVVGLAFLVVLVVAAFSKSTASASVLTRRDWLAWQSSRSLAAVCRFCSFSRA